MIKSIYTPLSGALAQERVLEIIANNLANANTVGYKQEKVSFKLIEPEPYKNYKDPLPPANYKIDIEKLLPLRGNEVNYVGVSGVSRDFSQGSSIQTKNPLDVMIEGEGYLEVHTNEGMRYTRNGSLAINSQGFLVDKNGAPVQGQLGPIALGSGKVMINHLGEVYQNNKLIDQLKIAKFSDKNSLEKVGSNYLYFGGNEESLSYEKFPSVKQGYLEGSNVNAIKNLTDMILAHRSYEAYQQAIKNYDKMMEKSNTTLGEVRG